MLGKQKQVTSFGLAVTSLAILFCTIGSRCVFATQGREELNTGLQSRTNVNPGLLYWQAFGALPRLDEAQQKELDDFSDQLTQWSKGSSKVLQVILPTDANSLLGRYSRSLRLLQRARLSTVPCDWGTDLADGPDMLVPDTRGLRELTKVSLLKAAVQLEAGSFDDSADTLLSCLFLARNLAKDGTLVSVMLQQAAEGQFVNYIGAEVGRYPSTAVARLRQGLAQLPPRVPVLMGVEAERNFQRWMLAQVDNQVEKFPGDSRKAYIASAEIIVDLFAVDKDAHARDTAALEAASGATVEGLRRLLVDLGSFYDQARILALAGPDVVDEAASALEHHVEDSSNPVARAAIPNFGRARVRELSSMSRWAMMEASLEQILNGDAALLAFVDPLSQEPFRVSEPEKGVIELRSRKSLGNEMDPVLRVMKLSLLNR
jgi:hypothetical protein